ncbi:hypothetical protein D3C78_1184330 [compost metagenome]
MQLLGFVETLRQVDRLHFLAADQVVLQQGRDEFGALRRVRKAVGDRDHVGARQGFHLEGVGRFLREHIEHGVAHRIGLQPERVAQRVDHVLAHGVEHKLLERLHQQFVEDAHRRRVLTLFAQLADGLADQRRRTQDVALGLHVRQRRRNEGRVFLVEGAGGIPLGDFLGLHDHLGGDIETLLEQQRQDHGDHGKDQENSLHQLLVGEEDPEELMQVVFLWIHWPPES